MVAIRVVALANLPAGAPGKRSFELFLKAFEYGALVRTAVDIAAMAPPLVIAKPQIDELVGIMRKAIRAVA